MRVLLDECVPKGVKQFIPSHQVFTTQELKWGGIRNGDLLSAAEREQFEVLITCDKSFRFQQRVTGRSIAVVELPTNNLADLKIMADRIRDTVNSAARGTFVSIDFSR